MNKRTTLNDRTVRDEEKKFYNIYYGTMTLSMTTFSITTLSMTTFSITTLSIMTYCQSV
jgi:hypothetical protein